MVRQALRIAGLHWVILWWGVVGLACGDRSTPAARRVPAKTARDASFPTAPTKPPIPVLPAKPPIPALPTQLLNLPVPGYRTAVIAAPQKAGSPPWPVIVILHGNYDRPEWECEWWLPARRYGWLVCPRGKRRPGVSRRLDRWTYNGSVHATREVHVTLDVLRKRHVGLLHERDATLIGFSLGSIIGPRVMAGSRLGFTRAIFVEGGAGVSRSEIRTLAKRGLGRVAYLCGQYSSCGPKARRAVRRWKRHGVSARLWIMPGVGHNYNANFEPLALKVLTWLHRATPL
jgi:hypothetical protein